MAGSTALLRAAYVFQATGAETIPDGVIRVEAGMIDAVGRAEEFGSRRVEDAVMACSPCGGTP